MSKNDKTQHEIMMDLAIALDSKDPTTQMVASLKAESEELRQALRNLLAIGQPDYVVDNTMIPCCVWCGAAYDSEHADDCAWRNAEKVLGDSDE